MKNHDLNLVRRQKRRSLGDKTEITGLYGRLDVWCLEPWDGMTNGSIYCNRFVPGIGIVVFLFLVTYTVGCYAVLASYVRVGGATALSVFRDRNNEI